MHTLGGDFGDWSAFFELFFNWLLRQFGPPA
jgi:hypothetical protein